MKRPIDLLVFDSQSETTQQHDAGRRTSDSQTENHARRFGDAHRTAEPFEYGKAMVGLAESLKARNKSARASGGTKEGKAKAKSRKTLSKALSRIFDEQGAGMQDDVAVRRPLKKPEDV